MSWSSTKDIKSESELPDELIESISTLPDESHLMRENRQVTHKTNGGHRPNENISSYTIY